MNKYEWVLEPDEKIFDYKEIKCVIKRQRLMGYLMGYIVVGKDHPWFNADPAELEDVNVHGGVAWTGDNPFVSWETPEEYWIGFYCGHAFDLIPYFYEQEMRSHPNSKLFRHDIYRNMEFAERQVKRLAVQAAIALVISKENL